MNEDPVFADLNKYVMGLRKFSLSATEVGKLPTLHVGVSCGSLVRRVYMRFLDLGSADLYVFVIWLM